MPLSVTARPAGTFVAVPPNVAHSFRSDSDGQKCWLNLHAPDAGSAAYMRGAHEGREHRLQLRSTCRQGGGRPEADRAARRPERCFVPERAYKACCAHTGTSLAINRRTAGADASVIVDDERGAAMAVSHLLELGHEAIAYVGGPGGFDTARRRERGVRSALESAGIAVRESLMLPGDYTLEGGYAAGAALLRNEGRLTGLFAANLLSGLGALKRVREAGLRVPDDLSLVVMDEHPFTAHVDPPLTTVDMPLHDMGRAGARMLIGVLEGRPGSHEMIETAPRLVVRGSTAPPPDPGSVEVEDLA